MNVLYVAASGRGDPVRAAIPYHLAANGSAEIGQTAEILLAGDATDVLLGDAIDTLEPLGLPPMRELVAKAVEKGIAFHVWKGCAVARGATDETLGRVNGRWITPPEVARLIAEADKVLTF